MKIVNNEDKPKQDFIEDIVEVVLNKAREVMQGEINKSGKLGRWIESEMENLKKENNND